MMELRLLGSAELRVCDGADQAAILAHPKRFALLAYLAACRPFGFHQRDALIALLWPKLDHQHARGALRQTLHRLRQSVGKFVMVTRGDEVIGLDAWPSGPRDFCLTGGSMEPYVENSDAMKLNATG